MRVATCQIWRVELEGEPRANQAILDATAGHEAIHLDGEEGGAGTQVAGTAGGNYRRGGGTNAGRVPMIVREASPREEEWPREGEREEQARIDS